MFNQNFIKRVNPFHWPTMAQNVKILIWKDYIFLFLDCTSLEFFVPTLIARY